MDAEKGMSLMLLIFMRRIRHTVFGTHMTSLYTFLAPCPQVLNAVGTQPAAREMGPRLSKCCFRGDSWLVAACAQLHIYTKNVPRGSTGICHFLVKNKKTLLLFYRPS